MQGGIDTSDAAVAEAQPKLLRRQTLHVTNTGMGAYLARNTKVFELKSGSRDVVSIEGYEGDTVHFTRI